MLLNEPGTSLWQSLVIFTLNQNVASTPPEKIVANACACTQGPFWLPWRIALVGQENQENVRPLLLNCAPVVAAKTLSLQLPMKFGDIVRVGTSRYLTKITTLEEGQSQE